MGEEELHYGSYFLLTVVMPLGYIYGCKVITLKSIVGMMTIKEADLRRDAMSKCFI